MNTLMILATSLFISTEPMNMDPYNAQHDPAWFKHVSSHDKSCMTTDLIKQMDDEIESLFKLAFYAYQDRDFDTMIEIFDMIDKHERLRQITLLNLKTHVEKRTCK